MGQTASMAFDGSGTGIFPGGGQLRVVVCRYNFATQSTGAVGTYAIGQLPLGVTVIGGYLNVEAVVTGAGASVAIDANAGNDIINAAAIAGAPWSTTGKKAIIPQLETESTYITTTAERDVLVNVSAQPITAGRFTVFLIVQNAL